MVDTSAIHALIARARLRLRLQAAFDGAVLATVLAFAAALVPVFAVRIGWVDLPTGWLLLGWGMTSFFSRRRCARELPRAG